jgi:hypothetical protein
MSITAMKQAVQALIDIEMATDLKRLYRYDDEKRMAEVVEDAITALRTAIQEAKAQPAPKQEPVATLHDDGYWTWKGTPPYESSFAGWKMDVYTAPVQAQPTKPMTRAQLRAIVESVPEPENGNVGQWVVDVCRAVEAAHGITGG